MSNEEIVARIQGGESLYCELWEQVEKFVAMQAGKISRQNQDYTAADYDDYYQSGFLAMVEAVESYSPDEGAVFLTWFGYYLQSAFAEVGGYRRAKDKASPLRYAKSLDAPINDTDGLTLADSIAAPGNDYEDVEDRVFNEQLHDALESSMSKLPEQQRDTLRQRFYEDKTLREVGEQIGISIEAVRLIENKALRRMRSPQIRRKLDPFIEQVSSYYRHVGINRFNTTHTSAVEETVLWRESLMNLNVAEIAT